MKTEYLKYFVEIANLKSINKASSKLFRTRSALVAAMNSLEQDIGSKLLNRDVRGVSLTEHGSKVYRDAQLILNMIESWQYSYDGGMQKKIILYSLPAIGEVYSLDILSELVDRFKQCNFSSDLLFNDIHTMMEIAYNRNSESNTIVIGGYYDLQREEFEHIAKSMDCIVKPLFSSSHSFYYNQESEKLIHPEMTISELFSKGIKLAIFKGAQLSIVLDNIKNEQHFIQVTTMSDAFNLISKNPSIMAIYPSFLDTHIQKNYDKVCTVKYHGIDFHINYCVIYNDQLSYDVTMIDILSFIERYPFLH